eukprot:g36197.t1
MVFLHISHGGPVPFLASRNLTPLLKPGEYDPDAFDSDMLERISNLENMLRKHGKSGLPLLGTPKEERIQLLKKLEESRLQIEKLEQRQKQLEKAISLQETAAEQGMNNNRSGVLRRASVAKPRKQAVVTPLQREGLACHIYPLLLHCLDVITNNERPSTDPCGTPLDTGLHVINCELVGLQDCGSNMENELELTVDLELTQKHKDYILNILNNGSLKQLKTLQRVGDKTAKLIMGWREHNGPYSQVPHPSQPLPFRKGLPTPALEIKLLSYILNVSMRFPPHLLHFTEYRPRVLKCCSHDKLFISGIILKRTNPLWTPSNISASFLRYEAQNCSQYSKIT